MTNRAVFLDRDGTIIEDVGHLTKPSQVQLIPGASEAIVMLNKAGFKVLVATNQSVIARGYIDERELAKIHEVLSEKLAAFGARVDGYYYCPHHPEFGGGGRGTVCDCRKPEAGLLRRAAKDLDLNLAGSFSVGDKGADIIAGKNAGCGTVLVKTGYGLEELAGLPADKRPDYVADDLLAAASWITDERKLRAT